jgi:hypothetical protein
MEFRSHTGELKYLIGVVSVGGLLLIAGKKMSFIQSVPFTYELLVSVIALSPVLIYFYYGLTNHNFLLTEKKIEVYNVFPVFRGRISIDLGKIHKILLKNDSLINLFSEYKYVIIQYKDGSSIRSMKFYCHGLEYDCNGENTNLPTFDDFYHTLKERRIETEWI